MTEERRRERLRIGRKKIEQEGEQKKLQEEKKSSSVTEDHERTLKRLKRVKKMSWREEGGR